jgi:hypothetical protein
MPTRSASSSPRPRRRGRGPPGSATPWPGASHVVEDPEERGPICPCPRQMSAPRRMCTALPGRVLLPRSCRAPAAGHRRRWLSPFRALQLAQSTLSRRGSGSPPRTSGTGWSAASSPGRTGCASRCQPGQVQPCCATQSSTVRFASRRQADVRRTGWSAVQWKRFAKPGRPQRSQRRSFVVGQPQAPVWPSQPRQAQTRERAIHGLSRPRAAARCGGARTAPSAASLLPVSLGPGVPAGRGGARRRRRGRARPRGSCGGPP